jgi:hypothetical protein
MPDYTEGPKKDVAEIKFLIHDLRVERFINEVIHFHVTLNTDLELYGVDQAQILHGEDLQVLKAKAVSLRKAYQDYSNAVRNFSPDRTVLLAGRKYVDTIHSACELILSPLWGRVDKVLTFLPPDSRSVKARTHYLNCIHWIRGVYHRIQQFRDEQSNRGTYQEFDIAAEIEDFTREVAYGYVIEHSGGRAQIELDQLDRAVVAGNLARFRRMYFNLVMNAVDAMSNRDVGVLTVGDTIEGDRVVLKVRDNGSGMPQEKIAQLLTDKDSLDGELDSLGFVFVRQTVREFGGDLSIDSELGKGTTLTIRFSYLPDRQVAHQPPSSSGIGSGSAPRLVGPPGVRSIECAATKQTAQASGGLAVTLAPPALEPAPGAKPGRVPARTEENYGLTILNDYERSDAVYPGAIFLMSVTDAEEVDFFLHAPYEKFWNIEHEDLSPFFFEASVRGRLEPGEEKTPILTLKAPQNLGAYFEFKNVPEEARCLELYLRMVRNEYILVARKLIQTGISADTEVLLDRLQRFFSDDPELAREPFPLSLLASQDLFRQCRD